MRPPPAVVLQWGADRQAVSPEICCSLGLFAYRIIDEPGHRRLPQLYQGEAALMGLLLPLLLWGMALVLLLLLWGMVFVHEEAALIRRRMLLLRGMALVVVMRLWHQEEAALMRLMMRPLMLMLLM